MNKHQFLEIPWIFQYSFVIFPDLSSLFKIPRLFSDWKINVYPCFQSEWETWWELLDILQTIVSKNGGDLM